MNGFRFIWQNSLYNEEVSWEIDTEDCKTNTDWLTLVQEISNIDEQKERVAMNFTDDDSESTNLTDDERNTLLSVTPAQLDQIIAGETSGSDILVTTLAVFGLILVIALLAA